ncbi:structure-specific endonuclease subunit SLX1 isoform X2 [Manihot esculenta]|uniref:structure-specific endonuclease subunit SLX1 isoform X2 n=1 Tax=Manihot esculenta TaxID=3983 RepID=UPI000B5D353E|nr:structure-specific endonuclease subunit SLX1 isoform X2 [Manihot esculenta]
MRLLSKTFRSVKPLSSNKSKPSPPDQSSPPSSLPISRISQAKPSSKSRTRSWCVYLILSTNAPIKTYVGVTNNFSRRLKQHNGELKGGAKASRAGRPWIGACIIRGFDDQSEGKPSKVHLLLVSLNQNGKVCQEKCLEKERAITR